MLNVHLNGDIIRCPDVRAIHARLAEERFKKCRCKYDFEEIKCRSWFDYCNKTDEIRSISSFGRCILAGSDLCPMHRKRQLDGLKEKTYKIDNVHCRKISGAAHYMLKSSDYKIIFLTLTFAKFKKYVTDKELNQYFRRYVENLRKRYNCQGYVAVREHGAKNCRVHYHLLLSIPFVSFDLLNTVWCNTIQEFCDYSKNAVQSDPKTRFIKNPQRAMRYVCKYFSKCKGSASASTLMFISRNLLSKEIETNFFDIITGEVIKERVSNIKKSIPNDIKDVLNGYKSIYIHQTSDYTTSFRITDKLEFERFCNNYLYKLFDLPDKQNKLLTG